MGWKGHPISPLRLPENYMNYQKVFLKKHKKFANKKKFTIFKNEFNFFSRNLIYWRKRSNYFLSFFTFIIFTELITVTNTIKNLFKKFFFYILLLWSFNFKNFNYEFIIWEIERYNIASTKRDFKIPFDINHFNNVIEKTNGYPQNRHKPIYFWNFKLK